MLSAQLFTSLFLLVAAYAQDFGRTLEKRAEYCPSPGQLCGGGCVDVTSNPANCGTCGHICPQFRSCIDGSCDPTGVCPPYTQTFTLEVYNIKVNGCNNTPGILGSEPYLSGSTKLGDVYSVGPSKEPTKSPYFYIRQNSKPRKDGSCSGPLAIAGGGDPAADKVAFLRKNPGAFHTLVFNTTSAIPEGGEALDCSLVRPDYLACSHEGRSGFFLSSCRVLGFTPSLGSANYNNGVYVAYDMKPVVPPPSSPC